MWFEAIFKLLKSPSSNIIRIFLSTLWANREKRIPFNGNA